MSEEIKPISKSFKNLVRTLGAFLALPGFFFALGALCTTTLAMIAGDSASFEVGLVGFSLAVLTLGVGIVAFIHASVSLKAKPSKQLRLPPIWTFVGVFGLLMTLGIIIAEFEVAAGLFFPPILWIVAAAPPLWAIAWFARATPETFTWRRGVMAFVGGATVSVLIALVLEILFPTVILSLVFDLADFVMENAENALDSLGGSDIASALTSRGFIFIFIQIAVIAPLAEEIAKPLVTLPLIRQLTKRDTFLVGAMAGAGFATLENVLYAGFGFSFWAGIILVRALGGALHPLGSGLVALGWRGILRNEKDAWTNWFIRFGIAAGVHALWNGGSLIVLTLAGAQFFGELPPEIDVLGLSAGGTTLALLIILGLAALWAGRHFGEPASSQDVRDEIPLERDYVLSDRALAIWAFAFLAAIVPAGIAGLQLLLR